MKIVLFVLAVILLLPPLVSAQERIFYEHGQKVMQYQGKESIKFRDLIGVWKDPFGQIWISSWGLLIKHNGYTFDSRYMIEPMMDFGGISNVAWDKQGDCWLTCTNNHIMYYDQRNQLKKARRYEDETGLGDVVTSVEVDRHENVWYGSRKGLLRVVDKDSLSYESYETPSFATVLNEFLIQQQVVSDTLAEIRGAGNGSLISQSFTIDKLASVILIGQGEMESARNGSLLYDFADYGWLEDEDGNEIWTMDPTVSLNAGPILKNRINVSTMVLQPGSYTIWYETNESYDLEDEFELGLKVPPGQPLYYASNAPAYPDWYGLQIYRTQENFNSPLNELKADFQNRYVIKSDFVKLSKDASGNIWAFNQSLQKIDLDSAGQLKCQDLMTWKPGDPEVPFSYIHDLQEKDKDHLWVSAIKYLSDGSPRTVLGYIHKQSGRFTEVKSGITTGSEIVICQDNGGNLWMGNDHNFLKDPSHSFRGLLKLSPPFVEIDQNGSPTLQEVRLSTDDSDGYLRNFANGLVLDDFNNLWVSTERNFLFKVDLDEQPYSIIDVVEPQYLKNSVVNLFFGDSDHIWFHARKDNMNWTLGTYHVPTGSIHVYEDGIGGIEADHLKLVAKLHDGNLVLTNGEGLIEYDPASAQAELHQVDGLQYRPGDVLLQVPSRPLNDSLIFVSPDWIVSTRDWKVWADLQSIWGEDGRRILANPSHIGNYWIETSEGVLRFKIDGKRIVVTQQPIEIPHQRFGVHEDKNGNWWSSNVVLFKTDGETGEVTIYGEEHGLSDELEGGIEIMDNGHIWMPHVYGLTIFDPERETAIKNDLYYEIGTGVGRKVKDENGDYYLISDEGNVYHVIMANTGGDTTPPKMMISDFVVHDLDTSYHIETNQGANSSITFPYYYNNLSIGYQGLQFNNQLEVEYQYRLLGSNDQWQEVGNDRVARFLNLPPGTYTFEVKGANAYGRWSQLLSQSFKINPPWYWSWWSKLLYGLLAIGLLAYWINSLRKKVKQKEEQLKKEQAFSTELKELNEANQKFVPVDFLQILGKESIKDLHLGQQTRTNMTVLFSDIRSYTTLSETMSADDNFRFINGYLGRVGPVIKKHGGFISSYMGDGLMALFLDDHLAAVRAAIAMQKVLEDYNDERKAKGREPINTGIGLNTGDLMLGIIGDQDRYDSTVISDAVNTASRMEGLTKIFGAAIIISEKTLHELKDEEGNVPFAYRPLGKVRVKGKEQAVAIYDLYEGEIVRLRQLKAKTQDNFEEGINHYVSRQFGKAAEAFKVVLENNANDLAAQYYLDKCVDYIVNDVPEGWNGVEEMIMK